MARECCHNCLYAWWDICQMMQSFTSGFPHRPACANHPDSLGRMRLVRIGSGVCRNYRRRPADPAKGAKRIPVSDGLYAYVDVADYEWLSQWTWHLINGYAARWEKGKQVYMHREIMRPSRGMKVDHKNRNKLDDTRDNLRVCTQRENILNQATKGGTASRFKGVLYRKYRSGRRKCYAQIRIDGKKTYLGSFGDEATAARVYDRAAVEHHGEFAYLNFPEEWPPQRRTTIRAAAAKADTHSPPRRTAKQRRPRATKRNKKPSARAKMQRRGEREDTAKQGKGIPLG